MESLSSFESGDNLFRHVLSVDIFGTQHLNIDSSGIGPLDISIGNLHIMMPIREHTQIVIGG